MHIQCISKRQTNDDLLYGTGRWASGEVKNVPDDVAARMLRHRDVYARPEGGKTLAPVADVVLPEPEVLDPAQEFYDKLQNFTMAQMQDFIKQQYNLTASRRQYPTVDAMRAYTRQLFERFGAH